MSQSDDLKRLAEVDISSEAIANLLERCRCRIHKLVGWQTATGKLFLELINKLEALLASNRAKDERIEKLRSGLPCALGYANTGHCLPTHGATCGPCKTIAADDDALRKGAK